MTVEVTYEGVAVLRPARLGLFLNDAGVEADVWLTDQLAVALEAQGVAATGGGVLGHLRLRVEFSPEVVA